MNVMCNIFRILYKKHTQLVNWALDISSKKIDHYINMIKQRGNTNILSTLDSNELV